MDSLHHRGESVSGARSTRNEVLRTIVFLLVHTHDNGLGVVLGRGRVDDLLGTSINDRLGLLLGEEDPGGLAHVVGSKGTPADFLGVTATGGLDLVSVKDKEVSIDLDSGLGDSVDGIVLVLVGHVVGGGGSGVDSVDSASLVFGHDTSYETSNTSETVDTHAGSFHLHGDTIGGRAEAGSVEGGGGESSGGSGKDGGNGELHDCSKVTRL
mmetsp:Transcript_10627/g.17906  ORF Transcript_10627/g.17906 Transcript_10627/m.17906 type:complete len:211 (-) Transcript_10627:4-636(-)